MSEPAASDPGAVLVTFALPDESRDFTARLADRVTVGKPLPLVMGRLAGRPVVVVHTGVGDEAGGLRRLRTGLGAAAILDDARPPAFVLSAGYAGGLAPRLRVGDLVLAENHSTPALFARARHFLADSPIHSGNLLTQTAIAETAAAKAALHAATGALAVDMETAWLAAACAQQNVPFLSLRVISDAADLSFPVPSDVLFDAARQRPRLVALPLWLLRHPARILPFVRFVRGLAPARTRLTRALLRLLESPQPTA